MVGITIEGTSFNEEHVQGFKTFKEFLNHETSQGLFTDMEKQDREALLKKVYEECHALKGK